MLRPSPNLGTTAAQWWWWWWWCITVLLQGTYLMYGIGSAVAMWTRTFSPVFVLLTVTSACAILGCPRLLWGETIKYLRERIKRCLRNDLFLHIVKICKFHYNNSQNRNNEIYKCWKDEKHRYINTIWWFQRTPSIGTVRLPRQGTASFASTNAELPYSNNSRCYYTWHKAAVWV